MVQQIVIATWGAARGVAHNIAHSAADAVVRGSAFTLAIVGVVGALSATAWSAQAQGTRTVTEYSMRSPQASGVETDGKAKLHQHIALQIHNARLEEALRTIASQSGLELTFKERAVTAVSARVTIESPSITVAEALTIALRNTGLQARVLSTGQVALVDEAELRQAVGTITGRVSDSASGRALQGATISVVGTHLSTVSGAAGEYTLTNVPSGPHSITVKLLGHASVTRTVQVEGAKRVTLNIVMRAVAGMLSEVVTTATGPQRRVEIGNDITTINADSVLKTAPIMTLTDLLATRVPGMTVEKQSGTPGAPSRVRIRGLSSINATNDPIVILDGVRMYASQFGQGIPGATNKTDRSVNLASKSNANYDNGSGAVTDFVPSPLDEIDPNSIETIEVLKGPSAVALYGTDAANGVIVITTKKGRPGPAQWSGGLSVGTTSMPGKWPDNYWEWGHLPGDPTPIQCTNIQAAALVDPCIQDSLQVYQILNNSYTTVLGRGQQSTYRGDVRGGQNGLTYALSGSSSRTTGMLKMSDADLAALQNIGVTPTTWQRHPQFDAAQSGQGRVDAVVNDRLTVSLTSLINRTNTQSTPLANALSAASTLSPVTAEQLGISVAGEGDAPGTGLLASIVDWRARTTSTALRYSNALNVQARPFWDITATATGGVDVTDRTDKSILNQGDCFSNFGPSYLCSGDNAVGYYNLGNGNSTVSSATVVLSKPLTLSRWLTIRTSVGGNYVHTTTNDVTTDGSNLPAGSTSPNAASSKSETVNNDDRATAGVYAEANIGIANRLFFPLAVREDAGSGLGDQVRPKFPKMAVSYVLSDESFFKRSPLASYLNTVRLRLAYGQSGVQPGVTTKLRTYLQTNVTGQSASGSTVTVQTVATLGNSQLKPELTSEVEGGMDVDFLDDRFTVDLTWYRKRTTDALLTQALPLSLGYTGLPGGSWGVAPSWTTNIGDVQNSGYEASLTAQILRGKLISWTTNVGLSHTKNVLLRYSNASAIAGGTSPIAASDVTTSAQVQDRFVVGYPLYGLWVRPVTGWADINGDGVITGNEVQTGDSVVYAGSPTPTYEASMHESIMLFSRLSINATFDYQGGMTQVLAPYGNGGASLGRAFNDPSTPLSTQAYLVGAISYGGGSGSAIGYTQTVSTFRFNELSIGYTIPPRLTRQILRGRQLNIALQGSNLGLWTNYRGLDPNVSQRMAEYNVDVAVLPTPRVWMISLGIN